MRAVLFDVTKCVGCGSCSEACREKNGLPETASPDLNEHQFTILKTAKAKDGTDLNYRRMCMHCVDPTCASVCPVGAIYKTANGPVVYNADICLGCRYCMQACPFGIPKYEWTSLTPRVRKCTFCSDRLAAGKVNACAEACPTGATLAGDRDELLKEAHARLKAEPDTYVQKVYGEHDAGGTSVLVISPIDFAQLGLPGNLPEEPLPMLTYRVLSKIPAFVGVGSVTLAGLWWLTKRKAEVANAEAPARFAEASGDGGQA
ncbi:MAG TPA: 4Fe-4S dicluster domain-containing protein [Bryobacteraceae bacterium]|nr:4Fe-4S dicluster domain-containing protein [Bryobacteraceae bacterium]